MAEAGCNQNVSVSSPQLRHAVGLARKGEWYRLDDELRPLIKKTLYVPAQASNEYVYGSAHAGTAGITLGAELSDICRVDGAFKLLSSTDPEVQGASEGASRLHRSVWTESRKASRRLSAAWELYDQGARITCGEATVSARNRNKLVKTLRAILSQGRDRCFQDKPSKGKAMACVAADPANSHFMRPGRYTRFKEWRFIHRTRLTLLPLNGTRTWAPAADTRCRRCGYREETLPHLVCHCMRQSWAMTTAMTERSNAIVARLRKTDLSRNTIIGENQQVVAPGLRPDLVLARGEEALVLDGCCPFDNKMQAFQEGPEDQGGEVCHFTATSPQAVPARLRRRHRRRLPRHVGSGERSRLPQVVFQTLPADNQEALHQWHDHRLHKNIP
ncbi:hypothetical protein MTO96_010152 [Rhipicephalus appendiculatus]